MSILKISKGLVFGVGFIVAAFAWVSLNKVGLINVDNASSIIPVAVLVCSGMYMIIRGMVKHSFSMLMVFVLPLLIMAAGVLVSDQTGNAMLYVAMYLCGWLAFLEKAFSKKGCFKSFGS
jgi:hypothetical protein